MKLAVIGTGYVGLVTGSCLAGFGNEVICVDVDEAKVAMLQQGKVPFYEPGLSDIITQNQKANRLFFTTDLEQAVSDAQLCFITVGTPCDIDGSADLKYVLEVARSIGATMNDYKVIVTKSTVPVGTAEKVRNAVGTVLAKRNCPIAFDVVSNPEFLREGAAVSDFMNPDRVVIGADNPKAAVMMRELYSFLPDEKIIMMDIKSSEMTKYTANALLATKISFMNEIANICEAVGADVEKVRVGVGSDSRIGYSFISPGCGYGGSCFPKDVRALEKVALLHDYQPTILQAVEHVNSLQKHKLTDKIKQYFGTLQGKTIAVWGLSFKPNTSDMREATSLVLIEDLLDVGARLRLHDPVALDEAREILGDHQDITYCNDHYEAADGADALVLITEWDIYKQPNLQKLMKLLKQPVIFDGRNQYSRSEMDRRGFTYRSIGRPDVSQQIH